ncbi:MAG: hypothetical protein LBV29_06735, partial [Azoarcus sp.]|nr:hypothetical protein [Azoarcus sp.]
EPRITLRNIHELHHAGGRVLLFEIPPAPRGIPIAWKGHYYARAGESLTSLGLDKQDEIRRQTLAQDWTAQIVAGATLNDLDDEAVRKAREAFAQKYANRLTLDEVKDWPLATFLDRARLTQDGRITRTTLLLLGKRESAWRLSPHPAQLTWSLEGQERAYEHFSVPFLTNTTALYQRIRNIQLRILPPNELVAVEIPKYDRKIVLEALHNCIAHQDYTDHGRIVVIEQLDKLVFQNVGGFFEGQPGDYIGGTKVPVHYRNPFLAQAMSELNMIDTMGFGIRDMYRGQVRRYFPLPDYDLSERGMTKMTIYGGVIDMAYSGLLIQKTDLPLADVLALDRVQKKLPIPDEAAAHLRKARLIEGRKPNYLVSAAVAAATESKIDYIRTRAQDDEFYTKLMTDYLTKFGEASRADLNKLLLDKLSDALTSEQRYTKVSNLLGKLRRKGVIENAGSDTAPRWKLAAKN